MPDIGKKKNKKELPPDKEKQINRHSSPPSHASSSAICARILCSPMLRPHCLLLLPSLAPVGLPSCQRPLLRNCPQWKSQQKTLWTTAQEETGPGPDRTKIAELSADERCSKAILDYLARDARGSGSCTDTTSIWRLASRDHLFF